MESVGEYEYHTKDLIGQGAFAMVYKGRNKKVSGIERRPEQHVGQYWLYCCRTQP